MSDRWAVILAAGAALGAARPSPVPLVVGGLLALAGLLRRRPVPLCLGVALLASALSQRSLDGLEARAAGPVDATVELVTDPVPAAGGLRADVRLGDRRLELRASAGAAGALAERLAGERIVVRGEVAPLPPAPWTIARHLSGRLRAYAVVGWSPGAPPTRLANALRRTLVTGASPLGRERRALYTGLVIGDDRAQPVELADDFQGAGLTHLLAVSGQNVAFALALARPLLRRLRLWPRLAATLAVLALFGLVTRFEPSVLRASAMAAVAVTTTTVGRPGSRLRVLSLAVTGLLLVDPLLVRSVGFQLSAAAAGAIVVLAPGIARALPGPAALRQALAVTLAAQLGVAPILLVTFGPVPVAALPANLLAVPAAGLVMVWGLTGGLVAGVAGEAVARLVHLPTGVLLWWVAEVAARAARLPAGQLGAGHLLALGAGLALAARSGARRHLRTAGVAVAAGAIGVAVLSAQAPPALRSDLLPGVVRWHEGRADVVVLGGVGGRSQLGTGAVLAVLREAGVSSIDLLVVADASVSGPVPEAVARRHPIGAVLLGPGVGPQALDAPQQPAPRPGAALTVDGMAVIVTVTPDRLVVEGRPGGAWAAAR